MAGIIARAIKSNNSDKYKSGLLRQILRLPNLLFLFLIRFYQLAFSPFYLPVADLSPVVVFTDIKRLRNITSSKRFI